MSGTESVRRVMTQAACVVNEEFDRLHREVREKDELSKAQKQEIRILSEDLHYVDMRRKKAEENFDISLRFFILACLSAGCAIGYAVWVG